MKIVFTPSAWADYLWFQENDRRLLRRINLLIQDAGRQPFTGIGKPEPLKADLAGYWVWPWPLVETDKLLPFCRALI